jgi:DNA-binding PadR family transcriptional regulator
MTSEDLETKKSGRLPELTPRQFKVLQAVGAKEMRGRDLRGNLRSLGFAQSGPAFYQLMSRLEDAGCVTGRYETTMVAGQPIKERWYRISDIGRAAANEFQRIIYAGSISFAIQPA